MCYVGSIFYLFLFYFVYWILVRFYVFLISIFYPIIVLLWCLNVSLILLYSTLGTLCLFKLCYINKVDWIGLDCWIPPFKICRKGISSWDMLLPADLVSAKSDSRAFMIEDGVTGGSSLTDTLRQSPVTSLAFTLVARFPQCSNRG